MSGIENIEWIMGILGGVGIILLGNTLRNISAAIKSSNEGITKCRDDLLLKIDGVYVRLHGVEQNVSQINGEVKRTALWQDMHEKIDDERFLGLRGRFDKNDGDHKELIAKIDARGSNG